MPWTDSWRRAVPAFVFKVEPYASYLRDGIRRWARRTPADADAVIDWWESLKLQVYHLAMKLVRIHRAKFLRTLRQQQRVLATALKQARASSTVMDWDAYIQARQKFHMVQQQYLDQESWHNRYTWIHMGERPSKRMSAVLRGNRRSQAVIWGLQDPDNGEVLTDHKDMERIITNFYSDLYSEHDLDETAQQKILSASHRRLDSDQVAAMAQAVTFEELECAVRKMACGKVPGSDGLPAELYKVFWPEIGPSFHRVVQACSQLDVVPASWETAVVSLLFKKGARTDIKNYRPISLLNTDYKVLANALAARMAQVMPRLLHPDQTAFVPGRRIQCNILKLYIAQSFARRCDSSLLLMNCDMYKAYDSHYDAGFSWRCSGLAFLHTSQVGSHVYIETHLQQCC